MQNRKRCCCQLCCSLSRDKRKQPGRLCMEVADAGQLIKAQSALDTISRLLVWKNLAIRQLHLAEHIPWRRNRSSKQGSHRMLHYCHAPHCLSTRIQGTLGVGSQNFDPGTTRKNQWSRHDVSPAPPLKEHEQRPL